MPKTKKGLEKENKELKAHSPPDSDDLAKNLKKSNLGPGGVELEPEIKNPEDESVDEIPEGDHPEPIRNTGRERTAEEYLSSIDGPPTLQNLFKYCEMRFGFTEGQASGIADYAATTGDSDVFRDPVKLLEAMNAFGNIGNPSIRKVIIDFYLRKANIPATSEYEEKAGLMPGAAKRLDEAKKEASRIYGFNESTGGMRQVQEGEKGLTRQEFDAMKADWLASHPNALNSLNAGNEQEFIQGPDGVMVPNPNKKYSLLEHQALEAINRPGEITQLIQSEELKKKAQELGIIGGKPEEKKGAIFGMTLEEFTAFKSLMTPPVDLEMREILKKLAEGGTKIEDPALAALKLQLDEQKKANEAILARLDTEREERHKLELQRRDEELVKVKEQVTQLANRPPAGEPTEMSVIKDTLTGVGTQVGEIGKTISGLANQFVSAKLGGGPRTPGQQKIIDTVKDGARSTIKNPALDDEFDRLRKQTFGER